MQAFKIPDYLNKKIALDDWGDTSYTFFNGKAWRFCNPHVGEENLSPDNHVRLFTSDKWEIYEEPKPIKLYRYTYKRGEDISFNQSYWTSHGWMMYKAMYLLSLDSLVKTEEKDVEL
jgi:hypothetical protein